MRSSKCGIELISGRRRGWGLGDDRRLLRRRGGGTWISTTRACSGMGRDLGGVCSTDASNSIRLCSLSSPMGTTRPELESVTFRCAECRQRFTRPPDRVEDAPEQDWHPWRYFARCTNCGEEAEQAYWERNLLKAYTRATGPRTPEGIAATSKNIEGPRTPEQTRRTRFNAMKHGLYAKTATYFPARPGRYDQCEGCVHLEHETCLEDGVCLRRTEGFMRHHIAFEQGDPQPLLSIRATTHAGLQAIVDDMILAIVSRGVELAVPEIEWNPETKAFETLQYYDSKSGTMRDVMKVSSHPLLRNLIDFVQRNGLTLTDMDMTPKVQKEQELLSGHLAIESQDRESMGAFRTNQDEQLEKMRAMIERSQRRVGADPILIEHDGGDDSG